jgi:hypothetical protein
MQRAVVSETGWCNHVAKATSAQNNHSSTLMVVRRTCEWDDMASVRLLGNSAATNQSTRIGQAIFANNVRITSPSLGAVTARK